MKICSLILFCYLFSFQFIKIFSSEVLELEELFTTKSKSIWKYNIIKDKKFIGYIKFSKENRDGKIDLFYIDPNFRNKNYDFLLMISALNKLFNKENVDIVYLSPSPFEHGSGTESQQTMELQKLINYYHKKYGFDNDQKSRQMFLTKEKFDLLKLKSKL